MASRTGDHSAPLIGAVRLYVLYRIVFALLFLTLLLSGAARDLFDALHPGMYATGAYLFAAGSALLAMHALGRGFALGEREFFAHALVDIAALGMITAAGGGIASGSALPMTIAIACAAAILPARLALALAALASLTLLTQETSQGARGGEPNLFAAGLLGALLFAVAVGVSQLNARLRDARRQQALQEHETARLEQLNALIVQRMRTGLVVVDRSGEIELINQAAVGLLGGHRPQRPLVPRQPLSLVPELHRLYQRWKIYPWLQPPVFSAAGNEIQPSFTRLDQDDAARALIFLEDNRAQAQRAQQLKLASLGKLTAGIAHEIRNPLGAVSHAAQLLREACAPDTQAGRLADMVVTHTGRINDIVENVLQLSRQRPAEVARFALHPWLREFTGDFHAQPGTDAALEVVAADAEVTVEFDPSHLRQILTNLLDNALRHSAEHCGARWARLQSGIDPVSGRPWLEVRDRGAGVAPEQRERLFEPFFTTSHQGTGLGLYISRELCEMNRATLEYRPPEPAAAPDAREGACFRIGFAHPGRHLEPTKKVR